MHFKQYDSEEEKESEDEKPIKKKPLDIFSEFEGHGFEGVGAGIQASLSSKLVQKLELGELMKKDMGTVANP